jgi:predicted ester cyclase
MNDTINQLNKAAVLALWSALDHEPLHRLQATIRPLLDHNMTWHGPEPLGEKQGIERFVKEFWSPLLHSFPDLERQPHLFFGGVSNGCRDGLNDGKMWVTGTGVFTATFEKEYLSIPATGAPVELRWGEFCRIDQGRIVEIYCLLDLVDLMRQSGFEVLPASRGEDGIYPPPLAGDGVLTDGQDRRVSDYSLQHIRRFIFNGLNRYDQSDLASMGMAAFFHPEVQWYGPGGIGACHGLEEFEDLHQQPWLTAFPDRQVQDLTALIAEGCYSGGPGWAGVLATHSGEYLDCPATGKRLKINGLDWWKREGEWYIENWVFVDMVHLFRQMGVDLFQRLEKLKASRSQK